MTLNDYAGRALLTAVELVNSYDVMAGRDELATEAEAAALLSARGWVVDRPLPATDLERIRALRPRLRFAFGGTTVRKSVESLNALLRDLHALPQLSGHDGHWHWHYARPRGSLVDRVATTCAVALLSVIADGGDRRLRVCEGVGCTNVFVDASRPGSRRFCDARGCGNRAHVTAYRERKRSVGQLGT